MIKATNVQATETVDASGQAMIALVPRKAKIEGVL